MVDGEVGQSSKSSQPILDLGIRLEKKFKFRLLPLLALDYGVREIAFSIFSMERDHEAI